MNYKLKKPIKYQIFAQGQVHFQWNLVNTHKTYMAVKIMINDTHWPNVILY